MAKLLRTIAGAIVCAGFAAAAHAEPTADETLHLLQKQDKVAIAVLMGYQNGLDWAATDVEYRTEKNLYCVPRKLSLTSEMVVATLTDWVRADKSRAELPLGMALLLANEDKYPCPADKKL